MLTASDVSAALGKNKHMSPEKLLNMKLGLLPPTALNAALRHGTRLEPEARQLYESRTGERCLEFGLKTHHRGQALRTVQDWVCTATLYVISPEPPRVYRHPWLGGSPDGVTLSGRLVEIKCPYSRRWSDASLRHRYYAQVQTLMEVFDLEVCDLVQYYKPGSARAAKKGPINTFKCVEIARDREWFEKSVKEMEDFYTKLCDARAIMT
eukprot:8232315-Pyramimonas_sp.AAC.1